MGLRLKYKQRNLIYNLCENIKENRTVEVIICFYVTIKEHFSLISLADDKATY